MPSWIRPRNTVGGAHDSLQSLYWSHKLCQRGRAPFALASADPVTSDKCGVTLILQTPNSSSGSIKRLWNTSTFRKYVKPRAQPGNSSRRLLDQSGLSVPTLWWPSGVTTGMHLQIFVTHPLGSPNVATARSPDIPAARLNPRKKRVPLEGRRCSLLDPLSDELASSSGTFSPSFRFSPRKVCSI